MMNSLGFIGSFRVSSFDDSLFIFFSAFPPLSLSLSHMWAEENFRASFFLLSLLLLLSLFNFCFLVEDFFFVFYFFRMRLFVCNTNNNNNNPIVSTENFHYECATFFCLQCSGNLKNSFFVKREKKKLDSTVWQTMHTIKIKIN